MSSNAPSWAVVATVNEPPVLVQSFVAWHLSLGAAEIFLYFDRPDDPAVDICAALPRVNAIRCDEAHWQALGRHPHKHEVRQRQNAGDAYSRTTCDWLLHIDADEFLWPTGPVTDALRQASPETDGLSIPVAERIYDGNCDDHTIFAGSFRRPFTSKMQDDHPLFDMSHGALLRGLTGHAVGKAFARVGRDLTVAIHRPRVPKGQTDREITIARAAGLELLHFDGLTPLHWVYKLLRPGLLMTSGMIQTPPPHRLKQIETVMAQPSEALELHDLLKIADGPLMTALERYDLLLNAVFDPLSALDTYFHGDAHDLSPGAFDDWLWSQKGDLLGQVGLARG